MNEAPLFLSRADIDLIHDFSLKEYGGGAGVRDEGALESAIVAPVNYWNYEGVELDSWGWTMLAAIYWFHLSGNHPFIDGNKRTAFLAAKAFLDINGFGLTMSEDQAYDMALKVAKGEFNREALATTLHEFVEEQF